jgi:hypothetical protein
MTLVTKGTIVMVPYLPVLRLLLWPVGGGWGTHYFSEDFLCCRSSRPFILIPFNEI